MKQEDFETLLDDEGGFTHIREELLLAQERLKKRREINEDFNGIATGFERLDNILQGLKKSNLIIVSAQPVVGKTSFVLDIARHAACDRYKVGVFSPGISKEQVVDRIIASSASVPLWKIRVGKGLDDLEEHRIQQSFAILSKVNLYFDDRSDRAILQLRSKAHELQRTHGLDLLIVDHLQLIQPRVPSDSVVQRATEASRGLKLLACELNIPIIALSPLPRMSTDGISIPRLSDLRASGLVEQGADVVLFLHRRDEEEEITEEGRNIVEVIVAKHSSGNLGTTKLVFDFSMASFR
ncbi:MAG: DnaB-like helicase C-terminal domain-containing protein [Parcubacteria group bacterium]|nr:DnaB-like helicase C-terminal domain-containing protein [Parcubacteria group bacterium]